MLLRALAMAVLLMCAAPAARAGEAEVLYARGDYAAAAAAADEDGGAKALAVGARALLAQSLLAQTNEARDAAVDAAEAFARRALARDDRHAEGHLQLAIAFGFKARRLGPMGAHFAGLAGEARGHIEAALALDAQNPWAHASLGGWHLEIVSGGGAGAARLVYGATLKRGLASFETAVALDPQNIPVRYEFALALLAHSIDHAPQVDEALAAVANLTAGNAFERELQSRSARLRTALMAENSHVLARLVADYRGRYEPAERFLAGEGGRGDE